MGKLKMGMIGGGKGSFIGDVHRKAAAIDGLIELNAGAFSRNAEKSKASGAELFLPPEKCYGSYAEMLETENSLPSEERIDFVSIVTPNHMHFAPAKAALEAGFHVVCDKPVTLNLEEARELEQVVQKTGKIFALTHNYTGYPMIKQARALIAKGDLGAIRKVNVQYHQGWLSTNLEESGQKQAAWRTDPSKSGIAGAIGDIGTHAENLASYVINSHLKEVAADLSVFVKGRLLDDDAHVLLRFANDAKGVMSVSQVAVGEENNLALKVYGEKGSLAWRQEEPNTLAVRLQDKPIQLYRTGSSGVLPVAEQNTRIPAGHPEGYLEGFANVYKAFALHLFALRRGEKPAAPDFPSITEGIQGMQFIYATVNSSKNNSKWTSLESF